MVSKTVLCLALFTLVAVCHCMPTSDNQKRGSNTEQRTDCSNSNSNEDQQPCDFTQNKGKGLKMQDTSASEEWGKKMKVQLSGEDKNSMEIRNAPEHQRMGESRTGPDYARGYKVRENIQKSRNNQDVDSNENCSQAQRNQINRHQKY